MTGEPLDCPQNGRAALEMLAASFGFATMSCIAHGMSASVAWPAVAFARIAVTMVMVCAVLRVYRAPLLVRGTRALWWRSLSGSTALLCTFYAVTHLPVTDAVTIFATGPIWITLILAVLFRRKTKASVWLHGILVLAGVYIMHRPRFDAESLPLFVALFGAVAAAAAMVSISFCKGLHPLSVVAHYATCASIITFALCCVAPRPILLDPAMKPAVWLWLLPMGLAGTLAQVLMTAAYARGRTTMVALVGISQIAFAAFYDLVLWGYRFDMWKIVGVFVIASTIAVSVTTNVVYTKDG